MKHAALFLVFAAFLAQNSWATPKADSITTFTGARTKLVWKRLPWCNDAYQPQTQAYMTANQSLMFFDTDVGVEKTLEKGLADIQYMRISRSGKWLTWNDTKGSQTYIMDLTAASPTKQVLLSRSSKSYWCARAFWIDPATKTEYVYCLDNYNSSTSSGNGIYKVQLGADGVAGTATKISYSGGGNIDDAISVSEDGKKIGCAIPWPTTGLIDVATGRFDVRHQGNFGCQANLAPDNSYRFFHCLDDHSGVRMYDANMSESMWTIDCQSTAPAWTCKEGPTDFAAPRWTNNLRFMSNTYPMMAGYLDGDCPCWANLNIWSLDPAGVKSQVRQDLLSNFFLAKFSSDFKSIEKTLMIAADLRYFQYGGDAWMCNGVVSAGTPCPAPVAVQPMVQGMRAARGTSVVRTGSLLTVNTTDPLVTVRMTDAQGRLVRAWTGGSAVTVDPSGLDAGVYVISVGSGKSRITERFTVAR